MPSQVRETPGQLISNSAREILTRMDKYANLSNSKREASIPRFHRDEIVLDKLIGEGGFNSVYNIHKFCLNSTNHEKCSVAQQIFRKKVSKKPGNYVIKFLSDQFEEESEGYANGSLDLVVEAKILANLRHQNIIRLHGISTEGVHGLRTKVEGNFFLVLDKLACTLRELQQDWIRTWPTITLHRLQIAIQITEGLCYLRRKKVLHRDIKPENIGFTNEGKPMLYDFGLSKILPNNVDEFKLTAMTGTLRYMSPECATHKNYGMASDVYSFTLILWELMSLEVPFRSMTRTQILSRLGKGGIQLSLKSYWPNALKKCIRDSSDKCPRKRPSINTIHDILTNQIEYFENEDSIASLY